MSKPPAKIVLEGEVLGPNDPGPNEPRVRYASGLEFGATIKGMRSTTFTIKGHKSGKTEQLIDDAVAAVTVGKRAVVREQLIKDSLAGAATETIKTEALNRMKKRITRDVIAALHGMRDVTPKPVPKSRRLK